MEKYDRQIRLWGSAQQNRLSHARIFLLTHSPLAFELAKNLVLAGIGSLIFQSHPQLVIPQHLGQYFGLKTQDIGKNLIQSLSSTLSTLNQDVQIQQRAQSDCSQILIFQSSYKESAQFAKRIQQQPVMFLFSEGQKGYYRLQAPPLQIIQQTQDTRFNYSLSKPIPLVQSMLQDLLRSLSLQGQVPEYTPWIVLLAYFKAQGYTPAKIKQQIAIWAKTNDDMALSEAVRHIGILTSDQDLPYNLQELKQIVPTAPQTPFWRIVKAILQFHNEERRLPISSTLPDLHTSTRTFLKLKQAYQQQKAADLARLTLISQVDDVQLVARLQDNIYRIGWMKFPSLCDSEEQDEVAAGVLQYWKEAKGGYQLPSVCSAMGGLASQQLLKYLSGCYKPSQSAGLDLQ